MLKTFMDSTVAKDTCMFCKQFVMNQNPDWITEIPGYTSHRLIFPNQPPNLAVCAPVGSFTPGYLLVLTRKHVLSFGELAPAELLHIQDFIEYLRTRVTDAFGPAIVGEHGSGVEGQINTCQCVDHAHIHIIPCGSEEGADKVSEMYVDRAGPGTQLEGYDGLHSFGGNPYLMLSHRKGSCVVYDGDSLQKFEKQFVRRAVAEVLGCFEEWNWREVKNYGKMKQTLDRFTSARSENSSTSAEVSS
jgi:diadenosine tetraphosphate (Ap4A) HIT family hydrolase